MKPYHRPRPTDYLDELGELFCEEDQTRCMEGWLCLCCYVEKLEEDDSS